MSTYNFRQYSDPDMTFATFLNNSRVQLGVPADIISRMDERLAVIEGREWMVEPTAITPPFPQQMSLFS